MSNKVKAMLVERDIKHKDIAEALELTAGTVSAVIRGRRQSRRVKLYIADLLHQDYAKLWGKAA